jgi:uncharacterized membrane protein
MPAIGSGTNTGTGTQIGTGTTPQGYSYQGWVQGFLQASGCTGCHNASGPQGGVQLDTYDSAKAAAQSILSSMGQGGDMPKGSPGSIDPAKVQKFAQWMQEGYPQTDANLPQGTASSTSTATGGYPGGVNPPSITYANTIQGWINTNCLRCHAAGSQTDLSTQANVTRLSDQIWSDVYSGKMPQGGSLSQDQKNILEQWIDSGAF